MSFLRKILDSIFGILVMLYLRIKYGILELLGQWPEMCPECNYHYIEKGEKFCPGCAAYRDHQS